MNVIKGYYWSDEEKAYGINENKPNKRPHRRTKELNLPEKFMKTLRLTAIKRNTKSYIDFVFAYEEDKAAISIIHIKDKFSESRMDIVEGRLKKENEHHRCFTYLKTNGIALDFWSYNNDQNSQNVQSV